MKKIFYLVFVCMTFMLFSENVLAEKTPNGIVIRDNGGSSTTELVCFYEDETSFSIQDNNGHLNFNLGNYGDKLPFHRFNYDELKTYGFLNSENKWDCPKYALFQDNKITAFINIESGNTDNLIKLDNSSSTCKGNCSIQDPSVNNIKCEYKSNSGDTLSIEQAENNCKVTNSEGTFESKTACNGIAANYCPDLFYNKKTNQIKWGTYDYSSWFDGNHNNYDVNMHDFICGNDNGNVDYYCSGNCEFPNNSTVKSKCDSINGTIYNTDIPDFCTQAGVLKSFRFLGYLLFVVKILVPIILIIMGSIDFGKAVIASNQDAIQKSAKMFAIRICAGIAIFLLPTLVNFLFGLIPTSVIKNDSCRLCLFEPNDCNIIDDDQTSSSNNNNSNNGGGSTTHESSSGQTHGGGGGKF